MNKKSGVPYHIAMIMDGNRRWAKKNNLSNLEGHKKGCEQFKRISRACYKKGIKILTVYAFSIENWNRNKSEVNYLMKLMAILLKKELYFLKKNNIKLNIIGHIEKLPVNLRNLINKAIEDTRNNTKGILNIALSYSGRCEIIDAVKKIIKEGVSPKKLKEEVFEKYLCTSGQPDPDLVIRTSGEMRLSNFLPWQSVYSELYFSDKLWPDFSESDLNKAIKEFQKRQRRFGK